MATYYWVGLGANTNASTTGNWSLSSGGIPQASVPSGSDKAQFDGGYSVQVVHDEEVLRLVLVKVEVVDAVEVWHTEVDHVPEVVAVLKGVLRRINEHHGLVEDLDL